MRTILILFVIFPLLASCQSSLEDGNLDFEKLNFDTFNTRKYYSKSLKAEWADYHKMRKSNQKEIYFFQSESDTIDIDGNDFRIVEPYAIIYSQTGIGRSNWNKDYCVGFLKNLKFDEVNAITDLKNNLLMILGETGSIRTEDIEKFSMELTKLYGNPTLTNVSFGMSSYDIKKWNFEDKIISLVSFGKIDYQNVILDENQKKYIKEIESRNHTFATLFICRSGYYDVFRKMNTRKGFMVRFEK
ncbi:hypothetical protein D1J36_007940 [Riemerella anatipestifer]|uniref:hypothetical protein n=1 Tax=Riemerella anatipestifer TaxID=34085 RepID=UPI0012ADDA80|nr:hypothetical protein [Riemerella anatipestifer]USL95203.1 hypothetical protein D1J36_007940 [Riemerella anatipestifer]